MKIVSVLSFILFNFQVSAQNLINNGNFEDHDNVNCLTCYDPITYSAVLKDGLTRIGYRLLSVIKSTIYMSVDCAISANINPTKGIHILNCYCMMVIILEMET